MDTHPFGDLDTLNWMADHMLLIAILLIVALLIAIPLLIKQEREEKQHSQPLNPFVMKPTDLNYQVGGVRHNITEEPIITGDTMIDLRDNNIGTAERITKSSIAMRYGNAIEAIPADYARKLIPQLETV